VPQLGLYTLKMASDEIQRGFKSTFGNFLMEGMVLKPLVQLYNRKDERIMTKIKGKDFPKEAPNEIRR